MNIFGDMDVATIKSNPNYVEEGEYLAEVTKSEIKAKSDGGRILLLEYQVTEPNSRFNKVRVTHIFNLIDEGMTKEKIDLLPEDEQEKIWKNLSALKRTLCGNPRNSFQKGLGVPADDLNDPNWNPATVVGTKIRMGISNWGDEGVNVRWVNLVTE